MNLYLILDCIYLVTAIVVVGFTFFTWRYQYWKRRNVPYLKPRIPFGNFGNPLRNNFSIEDSMEHLYKEAKSKKWKHCGLYLMATPVYTPLDLELVKNILTKDFNHFVDRGLYVNEEHDILTSQTVRLDGERWRIIRKKLTPVFTSGKLKAMFQTLTNCGLIFEKYFEEYIDGKEAIEIKTVVGCFTADAIGSCGFGIECNSMKEPNSPFRIYGLKAFEVTKLTVLKNIFTHSFPNIARTLGIREFPKELGDFYTKIVKDTIAYREENNTTRKDFMQLMMDMRRQKEGHDNEQRHETTLTLNEIIAQSFVFFVAGFETSSSTMAFALFELATHPKIQDKARKEIATILQKYDNQITYDSINEMTYMKQILDETLRLHSPFPNLPRKCVKDYKVPGEDVIIEKGTTVFISINGIHFDEEYYENPQVFEPDRFSKENKINRPACSYLPFGAGPRACIGERFAIMQSLVGLICILRNFRVQLNERTKLPLLSSTAKTSSISVEGGIWMNFEKP